jgi:PhzF family phenazine biosynthesis protein
VQFHLVDVFAPGPYNGNSVTVFVDPPPLSGEQMLRITQEMRHFESIFLFPTDRGPRAWDARVFDLVEELGFAGHPVLGAAAVLHSLLGEQQSDEWQFRLSARPAQATTRRKAPGRYDALLDQGRPEFLGSSADAERSAWFSLQPTDLYAGLPLEVVSTGLSYLIVPVRGGVLTRARITGNLTEDLRALGADYAYLLDVDSLEGRHWNNDGSAEDVATGSAAGCVAAYLCRHGRIRAGDTTTLRQGRSVGRPSELTITATGGSEDVQSVTVGGPVVLLGTGTLHEVPA